MPMAQKKARMSLITPKMPNKPKMPEKPRMTTMPPGMPAVYWPSCEQTIRRAPIPIKAVLAERLDTHLIRFELVLAKP